MICLPFSSSTPRPTILSDNLDSIRRTSIEGIHKSISLINSNEKFCTESLLKQKMCSSKKHNHIHPTDYTKSPLFPTSSLQKPRVFTYEDRNYSTQQQNILSSSSGSSTLSLKEKNPKEVGETRYIKYFHLSFLLQIFPLQVPIQSKMDALLSVVLAALWIIMVENYHVL